MFANQNYPAIALNGEKFTFVDTIMKMTNQNNFDDNKVLWRENPLFSNQEKFEQTLVNKVEKKFPQGYSVSFKLEKQCGNCVIILKQTFHPNWEITVNGKKQDAFPVFPFFIGVQLSEAGDYQITAIYEPSNLKIVLLIFSVIVFIFVYVLSFPRRRESVLSIHL